MPRGHSLSIYAGFLDKMRTSTIVYRQKGDHFCIQTRHNDLFFPLQSFPAKLKKNWSEKRVNTDASTSDPALAPWASHNTPEIQVIQYGCRIGKKVYYVRASSSSLLFCISENYFSYFIQDFWSSPSFLAFKIFISP